MRDTTASPSGVKVYLYHHDSTVSLDTVYRYIMCDDNALLISEVIKLALSMIPLKKPIKICRLRTITVHPEVR